jgi:hypothetical protein
MSKLGLQENSLAIGNQLKAEILIQGIRPLLWNHLQPSESFGKRQERGGTAGNDPSEWQRNVLVTENRQLYLLPTHIFGCLRDAAKYTKRGRSSLTSQLASTLQVQDRQVLINRYLPDEPIRASEEIEQEVYIFMSVVKNIATRGRNIRYRVAAAPGWQCSFTLLWDKTIISRHEMQAVAIDAGKLVGLADGRSIGYGRFEVMQFDVYSAGEF